MAVHENNQLSGKYDEDLNSAVPGIWNIRRGRSRNKIPGNKIRNPRGKLLVYASVNH